MHLLFRRTLLAAFVWAAGLLTAAPSAPPSAARSVHLGWKAGQGDIFYNEVRVGETTPQTYFCVCGFSRGYYGIQDLGPDHPRVIIFSVWDPGQQDDPNAVATTNRVEALYHDPSVRLGRFGGEGTGGQSFLDFPWKTNQVVRLLVHARAEGARTRFAGYLYEEEQKRWRHLITFRTPAKGDSLQGYYSFIEDFRRDGHSPNERRSADFGNGWVRTLGGAWTELSRAQFTGDPTPLMNIDAGASPNPGWFFLKTGGPITNATTELWKIAQRPTASSQPPEWLARFVPEQP